MAKTQAQTLTDHDEIRRWAEERGAQPACVRGTGGKGDPGMIRLDFPGFSGEGKLEPISWDQWFQSFDENNLALLVQERTARGERSNFNKLVDRSTAESRQRNRQPSGAGRRKTAAQTGRKRTARKTAAGSRKTSGRRAAARKTGGRSGARKSSSSGRAGGGTRRGASRSNTKRASRRNPSAGRGRKQTGGR